MRLPSYVNVSKKTTKACNLNVYRNLHHHHLNTQKKNFKDEVSPVVSQLPRMDKIWIHYKIFAPTARTLDTMNVGSIVDKYFSDALTELGRIPDDNYKHIVFSSFSFGGINKLDGHAIATIYELEKEKPMRILLDQSDIQTALDNHVQTLGLSGVSGVALSVNDAGKVEAEVLMGDAVASEPAPKPKNKGGRPKGSRNKPKPPVEETPDVEESTNDTGDGSDSGGSDASEEVAETATDTTTEGSESENPSENPEPKSSSSIFDDEGGAEEESAPETQENTSSKVKTKKPSMFDTDSASETKTKKSSIFDVD